jgi:5,5'-dehydrodivanillate O-demethylase
VLSAEKNELLTRVGPGTPMGDLLRRYWFPVAASVELEAWPTKKVRLLGEDLVLFRDGSGRLGLLEEQCPHRRASLVYSIVDDEGVRCAYHGWKFDCEGACLDMPPEPPETVLREKIRAKAYRAEELGGLIFAYLGPDPAPLLPRYDLLVWDNCLRDIGETTLPCNWLQIMENTMDPHHVEHLHGHYMGWLKHRSGETGPVVLPRKHEKIGFDVFRYGIIKRRVLVGGSEEDEDWKVGHPLVFPCMLRVGAGGHYQFQFRVPVDDTTTWHVWYNAYRPDGVDGIGPQGAVPLYEVPWKDERGEYILDFVDGQDIMTWTTQGAIADRTKENLARSDKGLLLFRRLLDEQMDLVAAGGDPIGVIRDPVENEVVDLPQEKHKFLDGAGFRTEFLTMGMARYSPIKDDVLALFERAEREAAARLPAGA